ncbi:aminopeptidase P family protein [Sulfitobacter mediterraneus]|uniref:M24 family metallopeptidase n=1 Tax=Sulfitobacter mediterraneus TaxID=83219 RepID=UPI0019396D17|nr:Xaa-Pro peptidase family protein [Sulfitobacter mediterraneus]MBM1557872.1 aminopeptidase P family protein [Sulfitobacter mediterraneus]MBM1568753.1 aminopeptidase P family protein [Sulfitobacter mediterraneus]MBM1573045.1 aminopeptidase P family protein [Sulfitobacter mediterraneus]MBM1576246.1 aminopeptidase P family protein [Sulfitobacter mediterraneus]MBM1580830.1 aminopeptidase P family protein [Sulfitobacter mediterraneus]
MFQRNLETFRTKMTEAGVDVALITDDDSVYYLTGYYDYLHMEFGRPTILIIPRDGPSVLITPIIDYVAAQSAAQVDRIAPWNDGAGDEWRAELPAFLTEGRKIAVETAHMPPSVRQFVDDITDPQEVVDATPILSKMRMIKSPAELQLARHAGQVANAMMRAGRDAIGDGVPEYEVAIATSQAGTRAAAELLAAHYDDADMSPNTHFLQIMASGDQITKTHHRASTRVMRRGEPVFLCFCGMTNFHRFKLGFDRTFWIGEVADERQLPIYDVAVASQQAALKVLRPGVTAQSVHAAYAEVIQTAGFEYPFRCGRATGFSYLEHPQLVTGDTTVLQPGMVLAVDGSVNTDHFRAQVGDSFIITEDGYEQITDHSKALDDVVL